MLMGFCGLVTRTHVADNSGCDTQLNTPWICLFLVSQTVATEHSCKKLPSASQNHICSHGYGYYSDNAFKSWMLSSFINHLLVTQHAFLYHLLVLPSSFLYVFSHLRFNGKKHQCFISNVWAKFWRSADGHVVLKTSVFTMVSIFAK